MTDAELQELIALPKILTIAGVKKIAERKVEPAYRRADVQLDADSENEFFLKVRESLDDPADFSVILSVRLKSGEQLNLIRCNGGSHSHKNLIEKTKIRGQHIHMATQRYIDMGCKAEGFAQGTKDYNSLDEAVDCMMRKANISREVTDNNTSLF